MLYLNCTKLWHLECGKMNETTDRGTDHDAKRQTQHMANVLRADTMHVAVVHQAAVDVWSLVCALHLLPVEAWMLLGLHAFPVPLPPLGLRISGRPGGLTLLCSGQAH